MFPFANAPIGLQMDQRSCRVINRTGGATRIGDVVQFDMSSVATETTTGPTGSAGLTGNVITPATADLKIGWFAICLEVAADNAEMNVCYWGRVKAFVEGGTATTTSNAVYGDPLTARNGQKELFADAVTGDEKVIARVADETTAGTAELTWVWFSGIVNVFGSVD